MFTLEGTVLIQSSQNCIRMLVIIISRSSSKLGHVGSKTRSLDHILEKPYVHSKVHSFDPNFMNFVRLQIIIISRSSLKLGHVGSKTRSVGQILEKPCVHFRGHSFDSEFMKLYQNVYDHNI